MMRRSEWVRSRAGFATRCWYRPPTALRAIGAMRMPTDTPALQSTRRLGGPNSLRRSKPGGHAVSARDRWYFRSGGLLPLVELTGCFSGLLRTGDPGAIFVHAYEGGHPDHDVASFAVRAACGLIEVKAGSAPAIIEMTGYYAVGGGLATGGFLPRQNTVTTVKLSAADRLRKKRMIDCFASQRELLAGFAVDTESLDRLG